MKPFRLSMLPLTMILIPILLLAACAPVPATEADAPQPSPIAVTEISLLPVFVLTWERMGGFAGFCDKVVVYESGSAIISNCKGDIETTLRLTETQREQLNGWLQTLQPIDYIQSDPAVADAMTISLFFAGNGAQQADEQTIGLISQFASELAAQAVFNLQAPPETAEAEQVLRDYLTALHAGDFILGAKLYGGDTELLQTWNPDLPNDLPALLERACAQNGLVCMSPRTVTWRGLDADGNYQFLVEFTDADGALFAQGPCCGEEDGASFSSFLFRVVKTEIGFAVLDLPPYVP